MARKKRQQPAAPDARLQSALARYADVLDNAPPEHRLWLEQVVALTCTEGSYHSERLSEISSDLLGQIRRDGLVRVVLDFMDGEGNQYWWAQSGSQPPRPLLFALVRQGLADTDADRRARAASLLPQLAPSKRAAAALLTACLQDEATPVRWRAALALSQLAPTTPGVVEELARVVLAEPAVCPSLGTPEEAQALAGLSASVHTMRTTIEPRLPRTARAAGAPEAARVLAGMGSYAQPALPALRERLARGPGRNGADLAAWQAAREAVELITGSTDEGNALMVNWIRRALAQEVPGEVGRQLLLDLAQLDRAGVEIWSLFTDALRNPELAATAAAALYGAGPAGLPALASALAHDLPNVRATAARTLARMGSKAGAAVPALVGALNDPDKDVRQAVHDALASIHSYLFVTRHLGRSEEEAFLESILETLGDEAPCLIYADWLEEYGNAAAQACARIVRERLLRKKQDGS
jgi:uncharacterized protein (TIGR02996 family)